MANKQECFKKLSLTLLKCRSLEEEKAKYEQQIKDLREEMERRIAIVEDKRESKCCHLTEAYSNGESLRQIILDNSSFRQIHIAEYIVRLLNLVEGGEYRAQECENTRVVYYLERKMAPDGTYRKYWHETLSFDESYTFYQKGETNLNLEFKMWISNKKEFSYVKDYIDALIQYRIDNPCNSKEELELAALTVLNKFLYENIDLIKERHKKRMVEAEEKYALIEEAIASSEMLRK